MTATEKLVTKHGVLGLSMREAARAIGVDPAASYRHVANREASRVGSRIHQATALVDVMVEGLQLLM